MGLAELWGVRYSFTVVTGAAAIIFATLWGPFTQNLIRYESGNVTNPDGMALLPRSVRYSAQGMKADINGTAPSTTRQIVAEQMMRAS